MKPPPTPTARRGLPVWGAGLIIGGAAAVAYHNSFGVPFIFDDDLSIRDNPTIRSLVTAWAPPGQSGLTVSGRPLLNFTLALNYAAGGLSVWGYHWVNLLIHVAAGCTLFGVVRRTLGAIRPIPVAAEVRRGSETPPYSRDATWLALAVALLWTVHPLQTQAVTYIVQRAESLVSLMYLLTFWFFVRSIEPGAPKRWAVLAWVACLLGMAAKEVMVTAPVMVALYDRIFSAGSWGEVWRRRGRFHLALAATWLLLAWLVMTTGGRGGTAGFGGEMSPWGYALTQAGAVVRYLQLALWPQPLVFDYGKDLVSGWSAVWWQMLLLASLFAAGGWAAWRGRAIGYLGAFFFAVLAPSSSFVPVVTQTMSEHRVYLALAAVVSLVVAVLYAGLGRRSFLVFGVLAVALTAATVRRNHDYRTEVAIWEDTVVKRPQNIRALSALAEIYQKAGRLDEARVLLEEAARVAPESVEVRNNLGNAWMKLGRWPEAIACFETAHRLKPEEPDVLSNLGNALLQTGRTEEAMARFAAALRLKPDFPEPRYNLANTLAQLGRLAEAEPHYARYVQLKSDDAEARSNYGDVLLELGRGPEALTQFEAAIRLKPEQAELHNNLGVALARLGRPRDAVTHFEEALRLQPNFEGARGNLERATLDAASAESRR